jgi:hypothetical protein
VMDEVVQVLEVGAANVELHGSPMLAVGVGEGKRQYGPTKLRGCSRDRRKNAEQRTPRQSYS